MGPHRWSLPRHVGAGPDRRTDHSTRHRLPPALGDADRWRAWDPRPGAEFRRHGGVADHQRLLGAGAIPVRTGPEDRQAWCGRRGDHRLRVPRPVRLAAGMVTFEPVALSEPSINPAWMILMNLISSRASASDQAPALQPPVKYRRRCIGRVVRREDVRRPAVRGPPEMGCYVTVMRPRAHRSEGNSRIAIETFNVNQTSSAGETVSSTRSATETAAKQCECRRSQLSVAC